MSNCKVTYAHVSSDGKMNYLDSLDEALALRQNNGYLWIDLLDPAQEDFNSLLEPFSLHMLSIEDSTNGGQLPKLENFSNYSFIIFNAFEYINDELLTDEVDLFVGKDFLISVSSAPSSHEYLSQHLERRLAVGNINHGQGPSYLAYHILDLVVDQTLLPLEVVEDKLEYIEDLILENIADFDPTILLDTRRQVLAMRKSLYHEHDIIGKILRINSPFFDNQLAAFFQDIFDHLSKYYEMAEAARDLVPSLMELHLSILNHRMTKTSNQTNAIVRRLTVITTIFMPLTLISGIGGMSEFTMMTGAANWKIAYFLLIVGMGVIAFLNFLLLKRLEEQSKDLEV